MYLQKLIKVLVIIIIIIIGKAKNLKDLDTNYILRFISYIWSKKEIIFVF